MITKQLIQPESIAVIGGSNDITKPGGKVLKNLMDGQFKGPIYVVNPKEISVQGLTAYPEVQALPNTDLAIIAIAAKYVPATVEVLAHQKNTKGFIILSAGFSEESEAGKALEKQIVNTINSVGGSLIGPNCIGVLTPYYHGVFTMPIPKLDPKGCDFISGSGATACFIMEAGIPKGLTFASVFSVGNSAQLGVEEVLEYLDETFDPRTSSRVKLLYIETIQKPDKLLKHASSLIRKGCRIAGIKAGSSEAGSRAASSHTGALASSDVAVDALFRKAGIVRCYGREDLISVASVFMHPELKGKNIAVVTHAGGPAVMLTDALSHDGLNVPPIEGSAAQELLTKLYPGSSVSNPIDFLATGTAEQLGIILDYVETHFTHIDGVVVIFGTPGLFKVHSVYRLLHEKMQKAQKPIFPVLPSILTAEEEVKEFIDMGHVNFPDEVVLGKALCRVLHTPPPQPESVDLPPVDHQQIRRIIASSENGYLPPAAVQGLLDAAGITRAGEAVVDNREEAVAAAQRLGLPVVMKVVGPVHKSDVGGVVLNVSSPDQVATEFERLIRIPETTAILIQPMLSGVELFIGAKYEPKFGHLILCGLGGIFVEVMKDVVAGLSPIDQNEALDMIRRLKGYKIIQGVRGKTGVNENLFAETIARLSSLLQSTPEIMELDMNPLLGTPESVIVVDARIRIEKNG